MSISKFKGLDLTSRPSSEVLKCSVGQNHLRSVSPEFPFSKSRVWLQM
jgi:hypothetical protein